MRPKLLAAAAVVAVLAFVAWPSDEAALESASVGTPEPENVGMGALLAVVLAAISLALFLQSFRPVPRRDDA